MKSQNMVGEYNELFYGSQKPWTRFSDKMLKARGWMKSEMYNTIPLLKNKETCVYQKY